MKKLRSGDSLLWAVLLISSIHRDETVNGVDNFDNSECHIFQDGLEQLIGSVIEE